jgi:hypothetical protein
VQRAQLGCASRLHGHEHEACQGMVNFRAKGSNNEDPGMQT